MSNTPNDMKTPAPAEKVETEQPSPPAPRVIKTGLSKTRVFFEFCGKHPLATGIFAVLSVLGLGFSIFGFQVDRTEYKEASAQTDIVESKIDTMATRIETIATPSEPDIPLKITGGEQFYDSWTFSQDHMGQSKDWIVENTDYTGSAPYLNFSVASDATKKFVQIAPYLVIDVQSVQPFPEKVASIIHSERGGAAILREFTALIKAKKGLSFAPLDDLNVDYITLSPGEIEEYFLTMHFEPGYRYDYKIGLFYRFDGKDRMMWLPQNYRAGYPDGNVPVAGFDNVNFDMKLHEDAETISLIGSDIEDRVTAALNSRKFMPSRLAAETITANTKSD